MTDGSNDWSNFTPPSLRLFSPNQSLSGLGPRLPTPRTSQHIIKSVERIMSFTCLLSTTSGQGRVWGGPKPTRPPPHQPSPFPTRSLRSVRKKGKKNCCFHTNSDSQVLCWHYLKCPYIREANMFKWIFLYNFEWVLLEECFFQVQKLTKSSENVPC